MICDKCDNAVCKAYKGTCKKYRILKFILKFITFGRYKVG